MYHRNGSKCTMFDTARPKSKPMSYWNKADVQRYIVDNNLAYAEIYDKGYDRTGCACCAFGIFHKDNIEHSKIDQMEETRPKIHAYAMDKMGLRQPIQYIKDHLKGKASKK